MVCVDGGVRSVGVVDVAVGGLRAGVKSGVADFVVADFDAFGRSFDVEPVRTVGDFDARGVVAVAQADAFAGAVARQNGVVAGLVVGDDGGRGRVFGIVMDVVDGRSGLCRVNFRFDRPVHRKFAVVRDYGFIKGIPVLHDVGCSRRVDVCKSEAVFADFHVVRRSDAQIERTGLQNGGIGRHGLFHVGNEILRRRVEDGGVRGMNRFDDVFDAVLDRSERVGHAVVDHFRHFVVGVGRRDRNGQQSDGGEADAHGGLFVDAVLFNVFQAGFQIGGVFDRA